MHSSFAERTETASKIKNAIHPFYENEDISFYKNKLIHIEDIIEQKEVDRGNAADFQSFEMKAYYILTFQDDIGNTHEYRSTIKPKNVGSIMYYVVENGKIKDVFSESDKERLKKHISIKTEYKYPNKIHRFTNFCFGSPFKALTIPFGSWFLFSTVIYLSGHFDYLSKDASFGVPVMLGGISSLFIFIIFSFFDVILQGKTESFIQKKQNEERDAMLKTFI